MRLAHATTYKAALLVMLLAITACALPGLYSTITPAPVLTSPPAAPVIPVQVDVCNRVDQDSVAKVIGRKLVTMKAPAPSDLFGSGCQYNFGSDADGKVIYANLFAATEASYGQLKAISASVTPLKGLGDDAYTAVRPDGPLLWALVRGKGSVGVEIGGAWNMDRAQALAKLLIDFLDTM